MELTKVEHLKIRKIHLLFSVLQNKYAFEVLKILTLKEKTNVNTLQEHLKLSQSKTSQILSKLRKKNIVQTSKEGKFINYYINKNYFNLILKLIDEILIYHKS